MHVNFLKYIRGVSTRCDFEICGYIARNKIVFLKNLSEHKKTTFVVDPRSLLKDFSDIDYVFHSHPSGTAELSEADIGVSEEMGCPSLVYSVKQRQFALYNPRNATLIYFSI